MPDGARPGRRPGRATNLRAHEGVGVRPGPLARGRAPRSPPSRARERWKSKTSKFCSIRSGVTDLGMTTLPSCEVPADDDLARVFACVSAISVMTGSSRTAPCASGLQASVTMPSSACSRRRPACWRQRVQLDLVDRRRHAGLVDDAPQVRGLEVRDADRADHALGLELGEAPATSRRTCPSRARASGSGRGRRSRPRGGRGSP